MGRFGTRLPNAAKDGCWSGGRTSLESKEGMRDGGMTGVPQLLVELAAMCTVAGGNTGALDTCTGGITKGWDTCAGVVSGVEDTTTGSLGIWAPGGIPVSLHCLNKFMASRMSTGCTAVESGIDPNIAYTYHGQH